MNELELKASYKIEIPEPSGLSLAFSENELFTVSDKTGKIYKISFEGKLIDEIKSPGIDLEGITINKNENQIFCVEEKTNKIILLNEKGEFLQDFNLPKIGEKRNSGPEGITFSPTNNMFYILHEKNPGLLIEWSLTMGIINETKLYFAKDYSGISYSEKSNSLWIISDDSETLTKCSLSGTPIKTYKLPIKQAEGIAINSDETEVYVVSDIEEKLYILGLS